MEAVWRAVFPKTMRKQYWQDRASVDGQEGRTEEKGEMGESRRSRNPVAFLFRSPLELDSSTQIKLRDSLSATQLHSVLTALSWWGGRSK